MNTEHTGTLVSGVVTCSCGFKTQHYALAKDAATEYDTHIEETEQQSTLRARNIDTQFPPGQSHPRR